MINNLDDDECLCCMEKYTKDNYIIICWNNHSLCNECYKKCIEPKRVQFSYSDHPEDTLALNNVCPVCREGMFNWYGIDLSPTPPVPVQSNIPMVGLISDPSPAVLHYLADRVRQDNDNANYLIRELIRRITLCQNNRRIYEYTNGGSNSNICGHCHIQSHTRRICPWEWVQVNHTIDHSDIEFGDHLNQSD